MSKFSHFINGQLHYRLHKSGWQFRSWANLQLRHRQLRPGHRPIHTHILLLAQRVLHHPHHPQRIRITTKAIVLVLVYFAINILTEEFLTPCVEEFITKLSKADHKQICRTPWQESPSSPLPMEHPTSSLPSWRVRAHPLRRH